MDCSLVVIEGNNVVDIFVTTMDGSLVIMEGNLLSRFQLLQVMVALSLWKVVCCRDFCYSIGWQPCHYGRQCVVEILYTPMDCSIDIMEGSVLWIFWLHQLWYPCHYGRQSIVEIFDTRMDGSLVIMEGSLLSRFQLLQWMVALSLRKVVCCQYICYSNGWQPCHY